MVKGLSRILGMMGVLSLALGELAAQDPQFTQFYASPLYLNPAYAGTTVQQRFNMVTRLQWPSLPQAFTTYAFSYDFNYGVLNSGFGLMAWTDKQGTVDLRTTGTSFTYAYRVTFAESWVLSAGVQFGVGFRSIDREKFLFGDQFDFATGVGQSNDPSLATLESNISYFDFASGVLIYNNTGAWLGAAAYHMNEPNHSMLGDNSRLPMKWHVHGGYQIPLYRGIFKRTRIPTLTPGFLYKFQGEFSQLDLGANFWYNPIMVGLWYRGAFSTFEKAIRAQDAVALMVGLRFKRLEVGYSYDVTVSSLGATSGGAHELSLQWQFAYDSPAPRKKRQPIACPSFGTSVLDEFKY